MLARVPASSANLGPGFDVLAVALSAYIEVEINPSDSFEITTAGFGAGLFDNENHLAAQIAKKILGHSNFSVRVDSDIPLSRGLGSSAALAIAAALAAQAPDSLDIGNQVDGHAENAAASLVGGLVGVQVVREQILVRSFPVDTEWRFVAAIPDEELSTDAARAAMAMLLPGLENRSLFVPSSLDDRLHQDYRSKLLPFSSPLMLTMKEAGADGACWSGAGSTMLALAGKQEAESVANAARDFFREQGIAGEVRVLETDTIGAVVR